MSAVQSLMVYGKGEGETDKKQGKKEQENKNIKTFVTPAKAGVGTKKCERMRTNIHTFIMQCSF